MMIRLLFQILVMSFLLAGGSYSYADSSTLCLEKVPFSVKIPFTRYRIAIRSIQYCHLPLGELSYEEFSKKVSAFTEHAKTKRLFSHMHDLGSVKKSQCNSWFSCPLVSSGLIDEDYAEQRIESLIKQKVRQDSTYIQLVANTALHEKLTSYRAVRAQIKTLEEKIELETSSLGALMADKGMDETHEEVIHQQDKLAQLYKQMEIIGAEQEQRELSIIELVTNLGINLEGSTVVELLKNEIGMNDLDLIVGTKIVERFVQELQVSLENKVKTLVTNNLTIKADDIIVKEKQQYHQTLAVLLNMMITQYEDYIAKIDRDYLAQVARKKLLVHDLRALVAYKMENLELDYATMNNAQEERALARKRLVENEAIINSLDEIFTAYEEKLARKSDQLRVIIKNLSTRARLNAVESVTLDLVQSAHSLSEVEETFNSSDNISIESIVGDLFIIDHESLINEKIDQGLSDLISDDLNASLEDLKGRLF